ncbi:MAG: 4Fe-4S dicluster domain-containing protein [Methanobrevibacter sp.]|nr:4Fe-4S dicluster domain-containing protein [Methanobrevibacter sp.]MDO5820389.1 4Fe-4S dicluster domain-containing protein [Methanobrevibacter sp.]MDO5827336.1 4Fe-4S dicluster domain-containing protein [Methanobrevibacter sp.]MEE0925111.1 4Fe-4S dicluster domain-containing protein [Methanobrevibacter sp.]MEE3443487.1 4Fe-4S dicluster domain-containing protein [Methanobrevibacter sp.]
MEKLLLNSELCDGCEDCVGACEGLHGVSRMTIHDLEDTHFSIHCQHCEDAPCALICPTGAMSVDQIDVTKCIACGFCALACPFGAVSVKYNNAHKCNLCKDKEEGPACVRACSKRALTLVDMDDLKAKKQKAHIDKLSGLGKKPKSKGLIGILTADTRARKPYDEV